MRKVVSLISLVVIVGLVLSVTYQTQIANSTNADGSGYNSDLQAAVVDNIVDGDTLDLTIDGSTERVRLIGIDTPETVNPQTPKQCYGDEASAALRELLPEGSLVNIKRDEEARDRYGRLLLYVYRTDDQLFINQWMVENGYASAVSYRPNVAFEATFSQAESTAQTNSVGLWAVCDGPDQPLDPTPS